MDEEHEGVHAGDGEGARQHGNKTHIKWEKTRSYNATNFSTIAPVIQTVRFRAIEQGAVLEV